MLIETKVSLTQSGLGNKSLRTTIPKGIAEYLGITKGDYIRWGTTAAEVKMIIVQKGDGPKDDKTK